MQPWATLVVLGLKSNETRSWLIHQRGALAIHASKTTSRKVRELCTADEHISAALAVHGLSYDTLPRGGVIGLTQLRSMSRILAPGAPAGAPLANVLNLDPSTLTAQERAFGDYAPGRFAWGLEHAQALPELLGCAGQQRIWTLPDIIRDQVYAGLALAAH